MKNDEKTFQMKRAIVIWNAQRNFPSVVLFIRMNRTRKCVNVCHRTLWKPKKENVNAKYKFLGLPFMFYKVI